MTTAPRKKQFSAAALIVVLSGCPLAAGAQEDDLNLEDLTKTEVSSVSRRNQSLTNVPAAAFVVTAEDIRRSGAQVLPDVLRMVPGIQVAQIDSGRYAVTARGFNGRFANKLQVLIDGRSIYNPFFSGTVWELDPISLEDIERIEVIRGAGSAIWGVNAVSGVINIISKHSRNQTGGMISATAGGNGEGQLYLRGGSSLDADTSWKLSFQGRHTEPSRQAANRELSEDRLSNGLLDFRFDRTLAAGSDLSIWINASQTREGDLYPLEAQPTPPYQLRSLAVKQETSSQTLGGRYRWLTSTGIESSLQASLTGASAGIDGYFEESHSQFDIDYQGRYTFGNHDLLWGASHRTVSDDIYTSTTVVKNQLFAVAHPEFTQHTTGVFVHDEWALLPDTWRLGFGARLDHTNLGGNSFSPNATLMWTPSRADTLWLKYSKAPRMPARAEQHVSITNVYIPPGTLFPAPIIARAIPGRETLTQETMEGVEIGYRSQLSQQFGIDLSLYRYRYSDIVSSSLGRTRFETIVVGGVSIPYVLQELNRNNGANGWLSGVELSADWLIDPAWRMQLSYAWTRVNMDASDNPVVDNQGRNYERATARHFGSLRSQWNLSSSQQFDAWLRASSGQYRTLVPYTTLTRVPGYVTLDLRYAIKLSRELELAVTGRNLIGARRIEYVADYVPATPVVIEPSLWLSARWKF